MTEDVVFTSDRIAQIMLEDNSKTGGEAARKTANRMPEYLQQISSHVKFEDDRYIVSINGHSMTVQEENELSVEDFASLQPLGPVLTTEELFEDVVSTTREDLSGGVMASEVPAEEIDPGPEEVEKQSTYTEELMEKILDEAHKTKEFPAIIEIGSDFHVEFLYRHFTRQSSEQMKENALKEEWKAVISKHLDVLSDTIGKMKCGPYKFQLVPGAKPVRQRMYPLSMLKKDALVKMLKVLIDNDIIEDCKQTDWLSPFF